ncbi:MAG TPA: ABC transporter ATP-binding protein [Clostridia bacterium]|nr:ABC transporter ATP-binding protein [Clostridia bacterium]
MKKNLTVLLRGYKVLHGLIPGFLPVAAARAVFGAVLPLINIIMSAMIINALTEKRPLRYVMLLSVLTAVLNFVAQVIMRILGRISSYLSVNIWNIYENPLNEKQQKMDFEHIENPATRLLRQKIYTFRNANGNGILPLYWSFESMVTNLFTIIFSIGIFASVFFVKSPATDSIWSFVNTSWFAVLFILLVLGNAALGMLIISKSYKKLYDVMKGFHFPNMVGQFFIDKFFSKYQMGKDTKIYNLKTSITHSLSGVINSLYSTVESWQKTESRYRSLGDVSSNILSALVYIFVAAKATLGNLGIGSIVQFVGGITRFNAGITGFVNNISQLFSNVEALNLYFEFLDMPNKIYHGTLPVEKRQDYEYEVEFHEVSFKYPDTDKYALKHLNLKLNVGQRLAVVGMNGSGKTTMIKLLCRLYDPTEGYITLNGIDIRKYEYNEYMSIFGVVFQDFKLFSLPLGQNVAASVEVDAEKAENCLVKAGFGERLKKMPKGLDTCLYKDFEEDGVEISGGEAQKIAIARALYKDAPFVILDEPTAALDPIAEFEVYSKLNEIIGKKTAVFISHRLSSCRFSDDIAVFHEGQLIQRGSHERLVSDINGKYYELWNAQAQYYNENIA